MRDCPVTTGQANAIFDVLVEHAGAPEWMREEFVFAHANGRCDEFRFIGSLGFGGKYWRHRWTVTAYPEDVKNRPERQAALDATNTALAALNKQTV